MITLITVIAVLILLPIALYNTARANKQFTFVRTGEIKFVVKGKSFYRLLMDVPGYIYDAGHDLIVEVPGPPQVNGMRQSMSHHKWEWIRKIAGVYYVSIIYPLQHIHYWRFEWDKQTKEASDKTKNGEVDPTSEKPKEGDTMESYHVTHRNEWVDSLFFEFAYPLHPQNVELKGGASVNIKARFVLQIVKPRYLVFTLNGTWYPAAMNSIESRIADFVKARTLQGMFNPKLTNSDTFNQWFLKDPLILLGSIRIAEAILEGFEQTGSKEEREALGKLKISEIDVKAGKNRGLAKAAETEEAAKGKAAAILVEGKATAEAARLLGDALGHQREKLGDPLMDRKLQADTVGSFRGSALSIGSGTGHSVLVAADQKKEGGVS